MFWLFILTCRRMLQSKCCLTWTLYPEDRKVEHLDRQHIDRTPTDVGGVICELDNRVLSMSGASIMAVQCTALEGSGVERRRCDRQSKPSGVCLWGNLISRCRVCSLRNKGSKGVLPEGLTFYSQPFSSEGPLFFEGVYQGLPCKTRGCIKSPFHSKNPFWESSKYSLC